MMRCMPRDPAQARGRFSVSVHARISRRLMDAWASILHRIPRDASQRTARERFYFGYSKPESPSMASARRGRSYAS
jgi:hypothetical protein